MALPPGTHLGPYEIVALLGAGGMGEVYRARDTKLKRDVALKVLPDAFAQDPDRLARFQREAELLATLNHPNIAVIFSIEECDRVRFMTMELVDGRTLDRIIPEGAVSMALFFDIALALADGLSAAHRKHIIHRDLKPSNVMVTADARVKILDFGLARTVDADDVRSADAVTRLELTQAGMMVGTMPYMSPEQIEGRRLDHCTDLFSLGIMLYELATGARPFRGDSSAALMSAILRDRPTPVGERRRDVPQDVSRLIDRCLEKQPRDRLQTAHEILELRPSYGMGRSWYALHYFQWARGDYEQGIAEARRALDSDPLSSYAMMILGACLFTAGRLDEAVEICHRAVQQDPDSFVARWALGISLGLARRFEEAAATLDAAAKMSGRHSLALTALAGIFGQSGKAAEAAGLHRELMARRARGYVSDSHLALTAEAAGEREEAIAFARRAWNQREPPFILWARHFPQYRPLHSDSRFAAILREMDES